MLYLYFAFGFGFPFCFIPPFWAGRGRKGLAVCSVVGVRPTNRNLVYTALFLFVEINFIFGFVRALNFLSSGIFSPLSYYIHQKNAT
jgi:hypothetical protein